MAGPIVNPYGTWRFENSNFENGADWANFVEGLFNDLLGAFYEQTDPVDDIDRIYRQQEAQEFMRILDDIAAGNADWRDLASFEVDFLSDIDGFQEYVDEMTASAQYAGLYEDINAANGDPDKLTEIFNEYGNAGIETNPYIQADLASSGSAVSVLTGTVDNAILKQIIRDAAIGDGIFGAEVDFEDLPGYGGIWEGIIRHIKVIGKGIQLPIPDWLPLPGIFELPTIGEIFDTVTGPWKEASRQVLNDCMAGPDGVTGVNPNTGQNDDKAASTCLEDQSIIDVLTQGAENAVGQVTEATIGKVTEITDKITSCAGIEKDAEGNVVGYDPELTKQCAQGVIDTIKDIFGEGAVDPTSSGGIPDWVKGIIIGGTYGDKVIKEIEGIFDSDLDGDGSVGFGDETTTTAPPVTPKDFDCASVFKNGGIVENEGKCGGCLQGYDPDGQGGCVEAPIECPGEQVYNDLTGECEDPEPGFVEGEPCKTEAGESGTYDANGGCVADPVTPEPEPCANNATTESGCEQCADGSLPSEHENGDCKQPKVTTAPPSETGVDCTQPKPSGFAGVSWEYACRDTHCTDGTPKADAEGSNCPGYVAPETTPEEGASPCDQQNRVENPDGSCGECKPGFTPDPQGFDQCIQAPPECNDCSCAEYAAANPVECTQCPEGQSYCESTGQCEAEGDCPAAETTEEGGAAAGGGGGLGGGKSMFEPYNVAVTASPQLLARRDFPITDFLAGIFTGSRGGRA